MASKRFYTERINDKIVERLADNPYPNSLQSTQTQETEVRTADE